MKYKYKTAYLGLPVPGAGQRISPEIELKKYKIIENMLVAGTQGVKFTIFDDGNYRLEKESDDSYVAILEATGSSPSANGIVNGAYFWAHPEVRWEGLKRGFEHHLYLRGNPKTFEDPASVRAVSVIHPLEAGRCLLMAVADLRGESPSIELYPDGKIYSSDVARHASDIENPHGRTLYQDEIVIGKKIVFRGEGGVEVEVDGEDGPITFPAGAFAGAVAEFAGRRLETIDFASPGSDGVVLSIEQANKILFVQAQRRIINGFQEGALGEVGIGYHGEDNGVDFSNEFAFYNTGDEGVPVRAVVFCG